MAWYQGPGNNLLQRLGTKVSVPSTMHEEVTTGEGVTSHAPTRAQTYTSGNAKWLKSDSCKVT